MRQIVGGRGYFAGARTDRLRVGGHRRHRVFQRVHRRVEVDAKRFERGNEFRLDAVLQIAFGQPAEPAPDLLDGADPAGDVGDEIDDLHHATSGIDNRIVGHLEPKLPCRPRRRA